MIYDLYNLDNDVMVINKESWYEGGSDSGLVSSDVGDVSGLP